MTSQPRIGNAPWRTIETTGGMLNSIGLDNDGLEAFCLKHLPYLKTLGSPIIVSVAGCDYEDFVALCARLDSETGVAAVEINISCPNVSHGVDFGANPQLCEKVVRGCREACRHPIIAKLTPNVTSIVDIGLAAEAGGADAISAINTCLGMAVDWRRKRPMLGNVVGGLSGPAIKPIALAAIYRLARRVRTPLIGVGGIATVDDVMEFAVCGAAAVQIGTASFYRPQATMELLDQLPAAVASLKVARFAETVNTIAVKPAAAMSAPLGTPSPA